jgi:hypothetical protein
MAFAADLDPTDLEPAAALGHVRPGVQGDGRSVRCDGVAVQDDELTLGSDEILLTRQLRTPGDVEAANGDATHDYPLMKSIVLDVTLKLSLSTTKFFALSVAVSLVSFHTVSPTVTVVPSLL